jgi:hypothetical protein
VQRYLQLGSALPGSLRAATDPYVVRSFPLLPVPRDVNDSGSFCYELDSPTESSPPLLDCPTCWGWETDFSWSFDALQRHPRSSALSYAAGIAHPNRGSAPRIFHPFSGFREIEFHGLVSCRNRSWTVSLLSVPPAKIGGTSRRPIACFPAVIHQRAKTRHSRPYRPRFQSTPAFERVSLTSPEDYELPLSQTEACFPVALDH